MLLNVEVGLQNASVVLDQHVIKLLEFAQSVAVSYHVWVLLHQDFAHDFLNVLGTKVGVDASDHDGVFGQVAFVHDVGVLRLHHGELPPLFVEQVEKNVAEHGVNNGKEEDNPHQVVILEVVEDSEPLEDSVALCIVARQVHGEHDENADERDLKLERLTGAEEEGGVLEDNQVQNDVCSAEFANLVVRSVVELLDERQQTSVEGTALADVLDLPEVFRVHVHAGLPPQRVF